MIARLRRADPRSFSGPNVRELLSQPVVFKVKAGPVAQNRFAVIVPKRVEKTSVARHRIKRVLLASLLAWPPANIDCLAVVRRPASEDDYRASAARALEDITKHP